MQQRVSGRGGVSVLGFLCLAAACLGSLRVPDGRVQAGACWDGSLSCSTGGISITFLYTRIPSFFWVAAAVTFWPCFLLALSLGGCLSPDVLSLPVPEIAGSDGAEGWELSLPCRLWCRDLLHFRPGLLEPALSWVCPLPFCDSFGLLCGEATGCSAACSVLEFCSSHKASSWLYRFSVPVLAV